MTTKVIGRLTAVPLVTRREAVQLRAVVVPCEVASPPEFDGVEAIGSDAVGFSVPFLSRSVCIEEAAVGSAVGRFSWDSD
jgi:hypothetical protein